MFQSLLPSKNQNNSIDVKMLNVSVIFSIFKERGSNFNPLNSRQNNLSLIFLRPLEDRRSIYALDPIAYCDFPV